MLEPTTSNITIINPSIVLITEPDPLKRLELIGRSCYQSAHKITPTSAPTFVAERINVGHESILEHYRLDIMPEASWFAALCPVYNRHLVYYRDNGISHVVGNIRAFRDAIRTMLAIIRQETEGDAYVAPKHTLAESIFFQLMEARTSILPWPHDHEPLTVLGYENDNRRAVETAVIKQLFSSRSCGGAEISLAYRNSMLKEIWTIIQWNSVLFGDLEKQYREVTDLVNASGQMVPRYLARTSIRESLDGLTVRIITDRAVANELERHREEFSYMQESTRYVTYRNELQVVAPYGNKDDAPTAKTIQCLISTLSSAKTGYDVLTDRHGLNMRPQFARSVLPLGLKTEVFVTAPLSAWARMVNLRIQPDVHPQFRQLMVDLLDVVMKNTEQLRANADQIRAQTTQRTS